MRNPIISECVVARHTGGKRRPRIVRKVYANKQVVDFYYGADGRKVLKTYTLASG
jgi:hypothetical protein